MTTREQAASLAVGERIIYDDGRGPQGAEVLYGLRGVVVVQFDDRADVTAIGLDDRAWWDHITPEARG